MAPWILNAHPGMWGGGEAKTFSLRPSLASVYQKPTSSVPPVILPLSPRRLPPWPRFPGRSLALSLSSLPHCRFFLFFFLQNVRCGRTTLRAKEVDPLFWGSHSHYLLRGAERLRPGPGWGRGDGEKKKHTHTPQPPSHLCTFRRSRQLLASYCTSPPWLIFTVG